MFKDRSIIYRYNAPKKKEPKQLLFLLVLTLCEALIARNGSVMVSNQHAAGRSLSIFPHHHIVIARTGQLVLDLKDAFQMLKNKYGTQIPSMLSNITGPSRTADIEKTLVLVAHGPKELFVFLIDDFG